MSRNEGLRVRKKAEQRERIAEVAARLFAERGFDAVSILDVARAADVSDQTVYNYFPAKQQLVLDRADEFRELYGRAVLDRPDGTSPANALRPLVAADIDRYQHEDPTLAEGEFPALCVNSGGLRRFALELRDEQVDRVLTAILSTVPGVPAIVAKAHAAALVSVVQTITDQIGSHVLSATPREAAAAEMTQAATAALDDLDRTFHAVTSRPPTGTS